ncbi:winged helix-turn-helix transcriptional regulator [Agarilytica rhodophyticola]|uniref:winged helix-turn-helix transcriptional regulator n=1 Tax=Agarilytica rhodophyticola TaxID=1737490 RepID=UPI000B347265|nr:helix-turn-helix domain-containing protein [Agarilytica rhodophyticola]
MDKSPDKKLYCSLTVALDTIGDVWASLILRDLMIFGGRRRFEQLREALGISRNILTDRLNTLLDQGIVFKIPVEEGAKRMEYKLSAKGWDLLPMLLAMHQWSERWREDPLNSELKFVDKASGEEIAQVDIYSRNGRLLSPNEIGIEPRTPKAQKYLEDFKSEPNNSP